MQLRIQRAVLLLPMAVLGVSLSTPAVSQNAMSFFLTSANPGQGADLGGLAGADAYCEKLAAAVNAGGKNWRAYLSATASGGSPAVNARDRIGKGPWVNSAGVQIAASVEDLHSANNKINTENGRSENGRMIPSRLFVVNQHDILTGTLADGTVIMPKYIGPRRLMETVSGLGQLEAQQAEQAEDEPWDEQDEERHQCELGGVAIDGIQNVHHEFPGSDTDIFAALGFLSERAPVKTLQISQPGTLGLAGSRGNQVRQAAAVLQALPEPTLMKAQAVLRIPNPGLDGADDSRIGPADRTVVCKPLAMHGTHQPQRANPVLRPHRPLQRLLLAAQASIEPVTHQRRFDIGHLAQQASPETEHQILVSLVFADRAEPPVDLHPVGACSADMYAEPNRHCVQIIGLARNRRSPHAKLLTGAVQLDHIRVNHHHRLVPFEHLGDTCRTFG